MKRVYLRFNYKKLHIGFLLILQFILFDVLGQPGPGGGGAGSNTPTIEVVNGTISPSSDFIIYQGSNVRFTYYPFQNYELDSIIVNGLSVGIDSLNTYTLTGINSNSSLRIVFKPQNSSIVVFKRNFVRLNKPDSAVTFYFADTSNKLTSGFTNFVDSALWDTIFRHRADWTANITTWDWTSTNSIRNLDFYSYKSFLQAIRNLDNLRVIFETRCGTNYWRVTRINKATGLSKIVFLDDNFNGNRNKIDTSIVEYGKFLSEGTIDDRKRELCAFLANISHETTGGWPTAPFGPYSWGLYFKQEVGQTNEALAYRDEQNIYYPPAAGKGYFGRGPIQLSWNYNYGFFSSVVFGDVAKSTTNTLLLNPDWVLQNGTNAFMTGIWFWMTPQYPKPSCHDVMIPGKNNVNGSGFGATVNIINGGIECNSGATTKYQVLDRIGFYKTYCNYYNVSLELNGGNNENNINCNNLGPYRVDVNSCTSTSSLNLHFINENTTSNQPDFIILDKNYQKTIKFNSFNSSFSK